MLHFLTSANVDEGVFVMCMNKIDETDLSQARTQNELLRIYLPILANTLTPSRAKG